MGKTSNHIQRNGKFFTGDLFSDKTTNRILEKVDPPLPQINFDITGDWSVYGVTDEDSFIDFMGDSGQTFTNIVVSEFSLVDGRLRCILNADGQYLFFRDVSVTEVRQIGNINGLEVLDFTNNLISNFNNIPLPVGITTVLLRNNQIVTFNPEIPLPSSLEELYLESNQIVTFNPSIALPSSLTELRLSTNQLTGFNPDISLPGFLEILDLTVNQITEFNPDIALPSSLTSLGLQGNLITDWSDDSWVVSLGNNGNAVLTSNPVSALGSAVQIALLAKGWSVVA